MHHEINDKGKLIIGSEIGDFSFVYHKGVVDLGIIGLNTAFSQNSLENYYGKLKLKSNQFTKVCDSYGLHTWTKTTDFWIFLSHHSISWLNKNDGDEVKETLMQNNSYGYHLCGHEHKVANSSDDVKKDKIWVGHSLFGICKIIDSKGEKLERIHGYCIGELKLVDSKKLELTFFPRRLIRKHDGSMHFERDQEMTEINTDHTIAQEFSHGLKSYSHTKLKHEHNVADDYKKMFNGKSYQQILDTFTKCMKNDGPIELSLLIKAVKEYIATCPLESVESEHLLIVLRRSVHAALSRFEKKFKEKRMFISNLLEPEFSYEIVKNGSKSIEEVNYEIARLLAEIGDFHQSLRFFDIVLQTDDVINKNIYLRVMATNGKAVVLQNLGLYEISRELLEPLLKSQEVNADPDLKYYTYKHCATLLRRIDIKNIPTSLDYINKAAAAHTTYHIYYSRGFMYLINGDIDAAHEDFVNCLRLLGEYKNEYYIVHLPLAVCLLSAKKPDWNKIQEHLRDHESSLNNYGNFKQPIRELEYTLVEALAPNYNALDINDLCKTINKTLPSLLDSKEKLVAFMADIDVLRKHYNTNHLQEVMSDIDKYINKEISRFNSLEQIALCEQESKKIITKSHKGLIVWVHLTDSEKKVPKAIANNIQNLRRLIRIYLVNDFDNIVFYGEDYVLAKNIDLTKVKSFLAILFEKFLILKNKLKNIKQSGSLGIGIAFGLYTTANTSKNSYLFGQGVSLAKDMALKAYPQGVMASVDGIFNLDKELERIIPLRKVSQKGGDVYCSSDVSYPQSIHYLYNHQSDERRYFVNFGKRCKNKCIYCMTQKIEIEDQAFDENEFRDELNSVYPNTSIDSIDPYLFSLGYLNEPLDDSNKKESVKILKILLEHPRTYVQIATKSKHDIIESFIRQLEQDQVDFKRVTIMYSMTSIKHGQLIEPDRCSIADDLKKLSELRNKYHIVPFIKPFLPGMTDSDEELIALLNTSSFDQIVVGYPYFSRDVMYQIARLCIAKIPEALKYYNYANKVEANNKVHLEAPCTASIEYHSVDYKDELESFTNKLRNANKTVFISSPCVVAYQNKLTCFTNVGDPNKKYCDILCFGKRACPNTFCKYNNKYSPSKER